MMTCMELLYSLDHQQKLLFSQIENQLNTIKKLPVQKFVAIATIYNPQYMQSYIHYSCCSWLHQDSLEQSIMVFNNVLEFIINYVFYCMWFDDVQVTIKTNVDKPEVLIAQGGLQVKVQELALKNSLQAKQDHFKQPLEV